MNSMVCLAILIQHLRHRPTHRETSTPTALNAFKPNVRHASERALAVTVGGSATHNDVIRERPAGAGGPVSERLPRSPSISAQASC